MMRPKSVRFCFRRNVGAAATAQGRAALVWLNACSLEAAMILRSGILALFVCLAMNGSAKADMSVCNSTSSRVGVALGYRDQQGWITEGWWNLKPNQCEKLLSGRLAARYYYVYGIDYDRGGEWAGSSFMCTGDKEFTIRGVENCLARGYDRTGFFEVDTGEQKDWRVQFTDSRTPQQGAVAK
jgi:uncharacterized membrane protein